MNKLKLGAQLYTIRDYMKTEEDFTASMKKIADIGFKYVQVSGIGAVSPACIKEATEANGLQVVITHTPLDAILGKTEEVIANHTLFGCDIVGLGSVPGSYERTEDGYKKFCADLAPVVEKFKAAGKIFSYHNHAFEFERIDGGKHLMDVLLEKSDKDGFKFTVDCYWLHHAGLDVSEWLTAHKERIAVTHLKDKGVINGEPNMIEVMTGNMNYPRILKTLSDEQITWNFIEQDVTRLEPFESLKISYNNLKSTGYFE